MSDYQALFDAACDRLFQSELATSGFELREAVSQPLAFSRVYGLGESDSPLRYVKLGMSIDPRDRPWFISVSLGEGALEWPEADWNGLPLWRLVNAHDSARRPAYEFSTEVGLETALEQAARDLFEDGRAFLTGEVQEFRSLRAKLNASREPYKIHEPDPETGRYTTRFDPVSTELRRRFSSE